MEYDWDPEKDAENRRKHRLSLADGIAALEDPNSESWIDDRFDYGEERLITLGRVNAEILLVVTVELSLESIRIVSVRKAENMKNAGTTKVTRKPGDKPVATGTDWAVVAAMSEEEVHAAALADPDALPLADSDFRRMTKLVNVKKLRERLGQTQEAFAATYRIPLGTLRDWEQRRKQPDAPARAYLMVIARDPAAIAALLREAA